MTNVSAKSATIRLVASMPPISGILMSINTRSGRSSLTSEMASTPFSASPTSSKPLLRPRTARAARRNGAWSSTTTREREGATMSILSREAGEQRRGATKSKVGLASRLRAEIDQYGLHPAIEITFFRETQLRKNCVRVLLDGPFGDAETLRDGAVGLALGHLGQNFGLSRREPLQIGLGVFRSGSNQLIDHVGIDDRPTRGHHADRSRQLVDPRDALFQ